MPTYEIEGTAGLSAKLKELASPKEQAATLRAAVREPMKDVEKRAKINLGKISPGQTPLHKTYRGRLVSAGFAMRSVRMIVTLDKAKTVARAILGVRKEAFYVLQFWELGTAYIKAVPWLQPAFYQSANASVQKVGEVMKERIDRIAKKRAGGK